MAYSNNTGAPQPWSSGVADCCSDCGTCCCCCCTGCLYGENADRVNGTGCFVNCCVYYLLSSIGCCCLAGMHTRKALRNKHNLQEDCNDCAVHTFCAPCAICQETRELDKRQPTKAVTASVTTAPTAQKMSGN